MSLLRTFVVRNEAIKAGLFAFIESNWKALAAQEKPLQIQVSEYRSKRTLDQNAKIHAVLQEIAEKAWVDGRQYDAETWKEWFRRRLIGTRELPGGGEVGVSTTTLSIEACAKFIDQMEAIAATELGIEFTTT